MFSHHFRSANLRKLFLLPIISLHLKHLFYGTSISRMQSADANSNPQELPSGSDSFTIQFHSSSSQPFYGELNHCASESQNDYLLYSAWGLGFSNGSFFEHGNKNRGHVEFNFSGVFEKAGDVERSPQLVDEIPAPDIVSYNIMLAGYLKISDVEEAKCFFNRMLVKDITSWNTLISGLSQHGRMDEANELFSAMPKRNLVTWNAMISGYVESGDLESALELFRKAPVKGVIAWTAIITGYMRSGRIELVEKVFSETPGKNLVTWNAMMAGYVENGRGEDCLKVVRIENMLLARQQFNCNPLS